VEAQAKVDEKRRHLNEVETKLASLQRDLAISKEEKGAVSRQLAETELKIGRATRLVTQLEDEGQRWAEHVEALRGASQRVAGDCLVAAAGCAYLGPHGKRSRAMLVAEWTRELDALGLSRSPGCSTSTVLGTALEVKEWQAQGLPADPFSEENAVLVMKTGRWPLMIDSQLQANAWIKSVEGSALKVVTVTQPDFSRVLEGAVTFGQPVLIEACPETLDPALAPILGKNVVLRDGVAQVRYGDKLLVFHEDFRLYLTTKISNPRLAPELFALVNVIDFSVTREGLVEQMLSAVVTLERPDLEQQRASLIVQGAADAKALAAVAEDILGLVSRASGDFLGDDTLILALDRSKNTANSISSRVALAAVTEKGIAEARARYSRVAERGSLLYQVVRQLPALDPCYQYSLAYFLQLYRTCIRTSKRSPDVDERVALLCTELASVTYTSVASGLFSAHKLAFAFLVATEIARAAGSLAPDVWSLFLRGSPEELQARYGNPSHPGIHGSGSFAHGSGGTGSGRASPLERNASRPKLLRGASSVADAFSAQGQGQGDVPPETELLRTRAREPEKLEAAMRVYVRRALGDAFAEPKPLDLASVFQTSTSRSPLIFLLSPATDPVAALLAFAEKKGYRDRLAMVSLGQGQGVVAEKAVKAALASGSWVLLQNCHLATSWMGSLESIVETLQSPAEKVHENFRLWLTSMPSEDIPLTVLHSSLKMTIEPPRGLRANLSRAIDLVSTAATGATASPAAGSAGGSGSGTGAGIHKGHHPPDGAGGADHGAGPSALVFGLCLFHAAVCERRRFGPMGWNVPYDFGDGDLLISARALASVAATTDAPAGSSNGSETAAALERAKKVITVINYGGRVTDEWDQRALSALLELYLSPKIITDPKVSQLISHFRKK
jgi:dynein heavy chain